jgi:hypothetical protein
MKFCKESFCSGLIQKTTLFTRVAFKSLLRGLVVLSAVPLQRRAGRQGSGDEQTVPDGTERESPETLTKKCAENGSSDY